MMEIRKIIEYFIIKSGIKFQRGLLMTLFFCMLATINASAQQQQKPKREPIYITGKVSDITTGETLPGVNVIIKNSVLGTITNADGEFKILIPEERQTLIFSFIGYITEEVSMQGITHVDVKLKPDVQQVEEVVATGYQVIDKRELTSSVVTLSSEELDIKNALTVDQMLEGKAAGLEITNIASTPGAAAKVKVRSSNTFNGNQSPLWVIDGVIYEDPVKLSNDEINSFDNVNLIGNALTGINPQDIASINVLKDASATAIYGVRAAGGVISITTKQGTEGTPKLSYSFTGSVVNRPRYSDFNLMNSKERIDVSREMQNRNLGYPQGQYYENIDRIGYEGALMNYWDGTYTFKEFQNKVSKLETMNTDWFGELYQPAINQSHAVNVSGGSKNSRYYASVGYDKQEGTEKGVGLDRITARTNLDFDLRKNVKLSMRMSGSVQEATYNHNSINIFNEAYYNSRTVPIYNNDGSYFYQQRQLRTSDNAAPIYGRYNIFNEMDNSARNITNKEFAISAQLQWEIIKGLDFRSQVSYRNTTNLQEEWIDANTYYVANLRTYDVIEDYIASKVDNDATVPLGGLYSGGMISQSSSTITNQLNYRKVIGSKHVLNMNISQEARSTKYWGATGFTVPGYSHNNGRQFIYLPSVNRSSNNLDFESFPYDNMINWFNTGSIYPSITDNVSNAMSFFGIFSYIYDNRYIANFNMRSDGTNAFGQYKEYRFKPTWSASGRWNAHNEEFLKNSNIVNELALRVSYGVRGTIPSASPYLIIKNYGPEASGGNEYSFGENVAKLSSFPQTNLKWELNKTTNVGIDYSLWGGKVSGAFDYSYSFSDDLLLTRPVSLVNGSSTQQYNGGSKDVQSIEFSIRTINVKTKDFSWTTRFNLSRDIDRVLKGYEETSDSQISIGNYLNGGIFKKGFPSSGFYSYQFDGLDEKGFPTYANINRPDLTPDEQLSVMLKYEGQRTPQYYGGFGTEFKYKQLSMSANFSYKLGYSIRLLKLYEGTQNLPMPYENMSSEFNNRWRQPGDENHTSIPTLSNESLLLSKYASNSTKGIFPQSRGSLWSLYDYSDARTVKGDHIRLNSITVSYNMPKIITSKLGVSVLSLSAQASNVAVWAFDKELSGQDPNQVRSLGVPSLPTYSLSLNVTL